MKTAKIYYKGLFVDEVVCDSLDSFDEYFALTISENECKHRVVSLIPRDHLIVLKEDSRIVANFKNGFEKYEQQKLEKQKVDEI